MGSTPRTALLLLNVIYEFRATVKRVIDGDTIVVLIDHGFKLYSEQHLRLNRIDAPEKKGPSKEAGMKAAEALSHLLLPGIKVTVRTHKFPRRPNTLERYLADVVFAQEGRIIDVSDWMLAEGHAVPFAEK